MHWEYIEMMDGKTEIGFVTNIFLTWIFQLLSHINKFEFSKCSHKAFNVF